MLSALGKHQIVDINILAFPCSIFSSGKHFFPISLILNLEVMEDLILYMLSFKREQPYFMKIAYFTFKSKFSQFLHRFKFGIFCVGLRLVLPSSSQLTKRSWDFCMLLSMKKIKNGDFVNIISLCYSSIFLLIH